MDAKRQQKIRPLSARQLLFMLELPDHTCTSSCMSHLSDVDTCGTSCCMASLIASATSAAVQLLGSRSSSTPPSGTGCAVGALLRWRLRSVAIEPGRRSHTALYCGCSPAFGMPTQQQQSRASQDACSRPGCGAGTNHIPGHLYTWHLPWQEADNNEAQDGRHTSAH